MHLVQIGELYKSFATRLSAFPHAFDLLFDTGSRHESPLGLVGQLSTSDAASQIRGSQSEGLPSRRIIQLEFSQD